MTIKVADRGRVPPFIVMDVMVAAAQRQDTHGDMLPLMVGQPSTSAPQGALDAAKRALDTDTLGYTLALGRPSLRDRLARHYRETYGVDVGADRIAITQASSGGFILAFLSAFDAGDRVALASPSYPAYRNILKALGIEAVLLEATAATRYQPTPAMLAALDPPVDGLIVASPANPTGTMLHADEMAGLVSYCEASGIRLVSDEIYHGITYGKPAVTAAAYGDQAIVVSSFSKYYSMTGWRIGWMVLPEDLIRPVDCLQGNLFVSASALAQHAAEAAFDCTEELEANVKRYAANRSLLLEALPKAGFDRLAPAEGAFYLYADVAHLTNDSVAFCRRMLAATGVAATPGTDFDPTRGHATMRFSFAGATDDMAEAADRLQRWLG